MTLKDYLLGRRFELVSPLPREEIARRINAATPSVFNPFASGVTGSCRFGVIRLHWHIPLFHNGFAPVLSARLVDDRKHTRISVRWGATVFLRVFLIFWYALLLVMMVIFTAALFDGRPTAGNELQFAALFGFFTLVPLLFHFLFNRSAEKHLAKILAFLATEIRATEASRLGVPAGRFSAPTSTH